MGTANLPGFGWGNGIFLGAPQQLLKADSQPQRQPGSLKYSMELTVIQT